MDDIHKLEALIPVAERTCENIAELMNLMNKLGRIEIHTLSDENLGTFNALITLLNLLRDSASEVHRKAGRTISVYLDNLDR